VDEDEAGLTVGEDDAGEAKMDLLAPAGDTENSGAGNVNCRLPPGTGSAGGTNSCC